MSAAAGIPLLLSSVWMELLKKVCFSFTPIYMYLSSITMETAHSKILSSSIFIIVDSQVIC